MRLSLLLATIITQLLILSSNATKLAKPFKCPQATKCLSLLDAGQRCPLFPMVPGTFGPPVGPQGFMLTQLRRGVFHYSDDAYHSLILFGAVKRRLVVIDFPRSQNSIAADGTYLLTTAVLQVLGDIEPKRIDMVYSHRHLDHIGSARLFHAFVRRRFPRAKVQVWGSAEARAFLQRTKPSAAPPLPTVLIDSKRKLTLCKTLTVELSILGGHTESDVVALVPKSPDGGGVVHFVDVVTVGEAPFIQFTLTSDFERYEGVHEELLKLDFETFSTGHGVLGTKKDVRVNLEYTRSVIEAAQQAGREVGGDEVGRLFGRVADKRDVAYRNGAWALKQVLDLQVKRCTKQIIERWGCVLSVVDVFAEGHCLVAVLYNFVDK